DPQQLLHPEAVGDLVVHRREVVVARDDGGSLCPVAVLEVLLDPGVEVADAAAGLGDGLALDLEHEAQHPVGRRVLRTHVHDDPVVVRVADGVTDRVPVPPGGGEDGVVVAGGQQEYALRWSGGGTVAPLYWTGMPPSGQSLRCGCPSQASGISIRVSEGWPAKSTPKKS